MLFVESWFIISPCFRHAEREIWIDQQQKEQRPKNDENIRKLKEFREEDFWQDEAYKEIWIDTYCTNILETPAETMIQTVLYFDKKKWAQRCTQSHMKVV